MTLAQFLGIIRARFLVVLICVLTALAAAIGASLLLGREYTASTTLVVDFKGADPVLGVAMPVQMMPGYLATQIDIIQSHKVAVEVVKLLKLQENPSARRQWQESTGGVGSVEDWYADLLLRKLDVMPSKESSVIEIKFAGQDPQFAATIANAFAVAYQKTNLELRVEPARQSAAFFDERMQILRKRLDEAQIKLNTYQRDRGFTAQDERLDLESARLGELSGQYTASQAQVADAQSRQRQLREVLARGVSAESIPEVLANSLVQNLKSQLTMTEARLQQVASQFGKNHPEVKRLEADIESQKSKIRLEITAAATSLESAAKIASKREGELRVALAEQKAKLLKLNQGRDEMQLLMKEVETAQRAFDTVAQRLQQTNLESQASQTNISILSRATPPLEPSFPKPILFLIIAVVGGTLLGVFLALVLEILNRRVRTEIDLVEAVGAPFLGVMLDDKSARMRRQWFRRSGRKVKTAAALSGNAFGR